MRILHLSDIHIGVENYGRAATETDLASLPEHFAPGIPRGEYIGFSTRLLDFLAIFDEIVEYAITESVDLVLFAGDAYRTRDPSQTHQREFARRVSSLVAHGIPVFLLVGNHDIPQAQGRATSLEIFPTLQVPLVTVGDRVGTHIIETKSGKLQIIALPWIRRGEFFSQHDQRGKSVEDITEFIETSLASQLEEEVKTLDPAIPTILTGHVTVSGALTSSERSMMLGRDYVLSRNSLALPQIDYVGLGHIHKHQRLGNSPPIVYSGSLQRVDFSEENDVKGFCLVEIDPQEKPGERAQWSFIPVDARTFLTIRVVIPNQDENPTQTVLDEIRGHHTEGSVIRLHITLPNDLVSKLDERKIRASLTEAFFVTPFIKEWAKKSQTTRLATSNSITPNEALKIYLETHGAIDRGEKNNALKLGKEMIEQQLEN
jgi:exonuclease SbcD